VYVVIHIRDIVRCFGDVC